MVVLGRIVAPFGVQGWVKVRPFADDAEGWAQMPQWWLGPEPGTEASDWQRYSLKACRLHGDGLIAKLEGIDDRDAAEALAGHYVAAPREALPDNEEGEYYWADLIGLKVVNRESEPLGRVEALIETGANHVLCVKDGDIERLLPFIEQVIEQVDLQGGTVRVDWQRDW